MRRRLKIRHAFVEFIPKDREEGVLYVSIPYATAVHNCFCGCRTKVVTPISPVGWQLSFDGETVSLSPSVGNWSYPCRSHYVVKRDTVIWAGDMTQEQIDGGRARDRTAREVHFGKNQPSSSGVGAPEPKRKKGLLTRLLKRVSRK